MAFSLYLVVINCAIFSDGNATMMNNTIYMYVKYYYSELVYVTNDGFHKEM